MKARSGFFARIWPARVSHSLSGRIFSTVLVFILAVIVVFSVISTSIFYLNYEQDAEEELAAQARDAAAYLNVVPGSERTSFLETRFPGQVRYTLIAFDGEVLYESTAVEGKLGNHADRPEVKAAEEKGEATTVRYSDTLKTDTVYAAVRLEDGSVIRLAETRHSLWDFLGGMLAPMAISLLVVAVLVFVLSRLLTARIMAPIDALNFKEPLQNEIYAEMNPLLERIDEQQRQLKQQNAELALAENMRRDFSSNVSHEMKTPLQVISGYAELMKNGMVDPADRQRFAGLIYEEAQAMRSLINDVLILSRLDESAIGDTDQHIDLLALAHRTEERLAGFAEAHGVTIEVTGTQAFLQGSATVAEQMMYNLMENGIRYNQPQGRVEVFVGKASSAAPEAALAGKMDPAGSEVPPAGKVAPDAPEAALAGKVAPEASETILVQVRDTGVGIPEDMFDKVFERFFRVDKSRSKETGGTGLGLAIVKHAVLYHGGSIEVESTLGEGTSFTLRFPQA
ncbi:MAG: hypothetical protein LBG81_09155 [Coriobacteriaceae bacterium]|jgi:two-component system phosphate regulon sensor histidine kinase PhoR|nr:hypothetical protein [Coriobacteriaceae bacterium]